MKKIYIFLFYGEGGHKTQMERLLVNLSSCDLNKDTNYIGLCEGKNTIMSIKNYTLIPIRSKYKIILSLIMMLYSFLYNTINVLYLIIKYNPRGFISTGPGSILIPSVLGRIFHKKIVYIETWSRFETQSLTGKFMYYIANKFYVQNIELLRLYPNAIYSGIL